ncbi:hypothetical protein, conserved [Eimeria brunetti]|uniref:Uncharacterized protein n=1 Tax=Eimeria brunetti TaxID=51314 RepID=U6LPM1_9EIME|nr:hypothetical protein, conserved [Eimeria brunetti]
MSTSAINDAQQVEAGSLEFQGSYATLQDSGVNDEFLRRLDGGSCCPPPAGSDSPSYPPPSKAEDSWSSSHPPEAVAEVKCKEAKARVAGLKGISRDNADMPPKATTSRPTSGAKGKRNEFYTLPSGPHRLQQLQQQQQLRSPQQRHQELVAARREQQQQVTEAHNEWRWAERMQRVAMHQQQRHLDSDLKPSLQVYPSGGLPASFQAQHRLALGISFCPHRLASIYNLSIRYWDEGCASLAVRTLQSAVEMLQQYGLVGGCVAHTWEAMQLLRGSKQQPPLGPTGAAAPPTGLSKRKLDIKDRYLRSRVFFSRRMFVAAERELEEVRGHLGSLLCRASLRGYGPAVLGNADRRCSRIKQALARVEDDLLLLQDLQARYSRAQSSEWGDDSQQRQLQRLVPLNLMPCMSQRIALQSFRNPIVASEEEMECEHWARALHQMALSRDVVVLGLVAYPDPLLKVLPRLGPLAYAA